MEPAKVVACSRNARGSGWPDWRGLQAVLTGLLLCMAPAGCDNDGPTPGAAETPPPASSPSPAVTSAGYLHVLQPPLLITYQIDGASGSLHPPVTQNFSDARFIANDPRGRFVYAAHGGWDVWGSLPGSDLTIASYAPDPHDGRLGFVSSVLVREHPQANSSVEHDVGSWSWVTAGEGRIYGSWLHHWGTAGRRSTYNYVSAAVDEHGQLGSVTGREFPYDADLGVAIVDARASMAYKVGTRPATPDTVDAKGGVVAFQIQPDGQLSQTGWSNLCQSTVMGPSSIASPLVAARDFLFARACLSSKGPVICSYRGRRLAPQDQLEIAAGVAGAFEPSSPNQPVLIAMVVAVPAGHSERLELQLFSMDAEGHLQLLSSDELPKDRVTQILFHPSGRFLFVSDSDQSSEYDDSYSQHLRGYAIGAGGALQRTVDIDNAGGSLAISLPPTQNQPNAR